MWVESIVCNISVVFSVVFSETQCTMATDAAAATATAATTTTVTTTTTVSYCFIRHHFFLFWSFLYVNFREFFLGMGWGQASSIFRSVWIWDFSAQTPVAPPHFISSQWVASPVICGFAKLCTVSWVCLILLRLLEQSSSAGDGAKRKRTHLDRWAALGKF